MKFKYYLRGAGIGVIASTVILSIAFLFHKGTMSDAEVIERALELGMVMEENPQGGTLIEKIPEQQDGHSQVDMEDTATDTPILDTETSDVQNNTMADIDNNADDMPDTKDDTVVDVDIDSDSGTDAAENNPEDTQQETGQNPDDKNDESGLGLNNNDNTDTQAKDENIVTIVIRAGDVSRVISRRVAKAGLVEDAEEFNNFLGANDYDNRLRPGTYQIKRGSSFEQIAKILTGG